MCARMGLEMDVGVGVGEIEDYRPVAEDHSMHG